jgi:microcystin-dependent protein
MYEPFIGELCQFPYTFAPRGWAFCHGQLIDIQQNPALFSLLGTNFGGDGIHTFGLPDLRLKDEDGHLIQLYVGQIYENKPYMETSIALEGVYPPRD